MRIGLLILLITTATGLASCGAVDQLTSLEAIDDPARAGAPSALDPRGPASAQIEEIWWLMFGLGTAIYLAVMGYLLWAIFRKRRQEGSPLNPAQERQIVIWGGGIFPGLVLLVLFGFTIGKMWNISSPSQEETLTVFVKGYQWWWEVNYQELQVRTANEIHIPVGQRVEFRLTSHDVIHSFWIPQLHGKLDANPGRITTFHLEADEPGVYWGECAEFCGVQHAKMRFLVVAEEPEAFEQWLTRMSEPAEIPEDPLVQEGLQVFLSSNCVYCHTIEGTNATGALGPDLTHMASRRILGAGAVENTIGNLGGWISDPHSIKPGVLMPPSDLSGQELQALITFLETLK